MNPIVKELQRLAHAENPRTLFRDWAQLSALALANAIPEGLRDQAWHAREEEWHRTAQRYTGAQVEAFCRILGMVTEAMQEATADGARVADRDVVGEAWEALELSNVHLGQFFTPMEVCKAKAQMMLCDVGDLLQTRQSISVLEPAGGSGRAVLAIACELARQGYDPASRMHATLVDTDPLCCWMSYITLSLAGVPAVVVCGNSLTLDERWRLHTIVWRMGQWRERGERADRVWAAVQQALALLQAPFHVDSAPVRPGEQLTLL
jgi:hypothetical protein